MCQLMECKKNQQNSQIAFKYTFNPGSLADSDLLKLWAGAQRTGRVLLGLRAADRNSFVLFLMQQLLDQG